MRTKFMENVKDRRADKETEKRVKLERSAKPEADFRFSLLDVALEGATLEPRERSQVLKSINDVATQNFCSRELYGRVTAQAFDNAGALADDVEIKREHYAFIFSSAAFDDKVDEVLQSNDFVVRRNREDLDGASVPFQLFEKVFLGRRDKDGRSKWGRRYRFFAIQGKNIAKWNRGQRKTMFLMRADDIVLLATEYYKIMSLTVKFSLKKFVDQFQNWIRDVRLGSITVVEDAADDGSHVVRSLFVPVHQPTGAPIQPPPHRPALASEAGGSSAEPALTALLASRHCMAQDLDPETTLFRSNKLDGKLPLIPSRLLYYTIARIGAAVSASRQAPSDPASVPAAIEPDRVEHDVEVHHDSG